MNYFADGAIGARYARFRPDFHALAAERIERQTGPVEAALDVACGTGQSTRALAAFASRVDGVDPSAAMLAAAAAHARVRYLRGTAEQLPVADGTADLVNVALAFHWLDQPAFLREAARVLRPGGWLSLYNHRFLGEMEGSPGFATWHRDHYLARFPSPIRAAREGDPAILSTAGFAHRTAERMTHAIGFDRESFGGYLLTQSNATAAIESGRETLETASRWIDEALSPFFGAEQARFRFELRLDLYAYSGRPT